MTNLELTINLINGLNKAIKRDLELLELDRKSYLVAVESKNARDMQLANEMLYLSSVIFSIWL